MQYAKRIVTAVSVAALLGLAQGAFAADGPAMAKDGMLVNATGMTLYTFDKDPSDGTKSVCNGGCATNWPPVTVAADFKGGTGYSVITRDDGAKQLAYKGKPLYLWIKDKNPGDKTGEGMGGGAWHVSKD